MRKLLLALVVLTFALAADSSARADTTFTLSVPDSGLAGSTGPYGSVHVRLIDATDATMIFAANPGFLFLGNDVAAFNVNASGITLSVSATALPGFTAGPLSFGGSGNVDGFGSFNVTFDEFDGFSHALSAITFDLTNVSGTWPSSDDVLTPNSDGFSVADHVGVCDANPCDASGAFTTTGYAANGTPIPAPEPNSLVFLGASMLGIVSTRRKKHA